MAQRDGILALEAAISQEVLGQAAVIRQMLIALVADGHVLLESLPGPVSYTHLTLPTILLV